MRVLVIEDEYKIANSIKKGLTQEKFLVDIGYDGEEGFDLASSNEYDVVVLDLMLPKMDGVTLTKKLRDDKIHTPILMLTAKGEVEDKVNGLNAGADDYLAKPFAFVELLARVRALTRRPKKVGGAILRVSDLSLDTISFVVKRGNKLITLSKREFALLEYLMRNRGKVVSKDAIIGNVWSYDAEILPNTVEVFIGYLRQKVDKAFTKSEVLIHTVRGFGYKMGLD